MKVIISGGWSYGNIGDEAIARATQFEFMRIWPDAEYVYTAYDQNEFFRHHKIESQESVHKLIHEHSALGINIYNIEDKFVELKRTIFSSYLKLFNESDTIFVMSGGGYFLETSEEQFVSRILEIFLADSIGAKIILIGQSLGPFYSNKARALVHKALSLCSYINVRDVSSYRLIKEIDSEIDAKLSCDIANDIKNCYLQERALDTENNDRKVISMMLSVYSHRETAGNRIKINKKLIKILNRLTLRKYIYEFRMRKLVKYFYDRDDCVLQFVMSTDWTWDHKFIAKMTRGLEPSKYRIIKNATIDQLCMAIKNSDYMISCKMHPLIIANSFEIPTIGISYNFKVDDFMKSIGREHFCFINRKLSVEKVINAFNCNVDYDLIIHNSRALSEKIYDMFQDILSLC